ncbi:uncharacterized protein LOC131435693 isoform X2 [Malaya genurostris]|uniref:uncharacterized protein LOC131435693 isoform X2 n=1 Tax=Malaya genurostris TaxID=325434 RepID=UPI0026F38F69|nr:uncharacterized protein LOC131435693 isoform X2 [Malaya genurostris]
MPKPEMKHKIKEFRVLWLLILLVYIRVSGGEFYDSNDSVGGSSDNAGNHLLSFPESRDGRSPDDEGSASTNRINGKGLIVPEINFLAKLRQRQRERPQVIPAVAFSRGDQSADDGIENDWQLKQLIAMNLPNGDDANNELASLENDLSIVLDFLAKYKDELLDEGLPDSNVELHDSGQKRAAALRSTMARRSHDFPGSKERFAPSISIGALTNLGDFFQHLKHNLESLESKNLSHDQVKLLEGQNMISNLRKELIEEYPKPAGSAAFLHAIRNYRPSNRIRALVSSVPDLYRGTNFHDPVYKLAGLGK